MAEEAAAEAVPAPWAATMWTGCAASGVVAVAALMAADRHSPQFGCY